MKTKFLFTIAVLFCLGLASVQAQVRERAYDQHGRITNGVRHGELSRKEAHRLEMKQRHIHRDIRKAKHNDGYLSKRERRRIAREQKYASRQIYRYKHNGANRF